MAAVTRALITTSGNYKIVKSTDTKPLALVHDVEVQIMGKTYAWKDCPLRIHSSEIASLNFDHVISILGEDGAILPSARAGIAKESRTVVIARIDELFKGAIDDYRNTFKVALKKDINIFDMKKYHFRRAILATHRGCLGKFLALFAPMLTRFVYGGNSKLEREGSRHRVMWLKEVNTKEDLRLQAAKNIIINRTTLLFAQFEKGKRAGRLELDPLAELRQLNQLYDFISPEDPLALDNVEIPVTPARNDLLEHVEIGEYLAEFNDVIL